MSEGTIAWPKKTREVHNHHFDSTIWNDLRFRDDAMKKNSAQSVPPGGAFWDGGAQTFIHKGSNGRWRDVLTAEDNERYESRAVAELGEACAHWLATGELPG